MNATANATLNATASGAAAHGPWLTSTFLPTLVERIADLVAAPFLYPQMVYIITPMLVTLVLMEFYFGRYKDEELGWNTAVGHALVLIFVGIDLLKTVYPGVAPSVMASQVWHALQSSPGEAITTVIAAAVLAYGAFLLLLDFFHWLPKGLAFFVSGTLQVDILAYIAIVLVYTNNAKAHPIPLDWYTLLAAIVLFLGLWALFGFIHALEPEKEDNRDWEKLARKRRRIMEKHPAEEETLIQDTAPGSIVDRAPAPKK